MVTFGEKLKELRVAAGMTQAGLADDSGVPIGTIRDYEQGKRDPLLSTAQKLARALGQSLDVFDGVKPGVQGKAPAAAKEPSPPRGRPRKGASQTGATPATKGRKRKEN